MKNPSIYIDTSVIGGCFDSQFSEYSNRLFSDFKNSRYLPIVSEVVENEIRNAPNKVIEKYKELLDCNAEILKVTTETIELAQNYQKRKILTKKYFDDGLHIALATIYKIDLLVSWNFKHIVHFDKIHLFNAVNMELGYKTIEIFSPMEVAT